MSEVVRVITAAGVKGKVTDHSANNDGMGLRAEIAFPNGYGASVIQGPYSYGGPAGLWELAVLKGSELCYDTPVTGDVLGYQSEDDIADAIQRIAALPKVAK